MPKPTDIIDFLLTRTNGAIDRRDLEARLKVMRRAGLWPAARSSATRKAAAPGTRDCARLLMGIMGSNQAIHCAMAANVLAELPNLKPGDPIRKPKKKKSARADKDKKFRPSKGRKFIDFFSDAISQYGDLPEIGQIHCGHAPFWFVMIEYERDAGTGLQFLFTDFDSAHLSKLTKFTIQTNRLMSGHYVKLMAEFLGIIDGGTEI